MLRIFQLELWSFLHLEIVSVQHYILIEWDKIVSYVDLYRKYMILYTGRYLEKVEVITIFLKWKKRRIDL